VYRRLSSRPLAPLAAEAGRRHASIPAVAKAIGQDSELQILASAQRQRWWERFSPTVVGCVVAVVLALWSTAGARGSRPPHGVDVMSYLVRANFALPHLVAHGRLDGWFPRFYLGYQEFLFNGPGVTWAMGAARGVTLGALSNAGALKVVGVASFAALPVAMAFLARSLGLGRLAAGIAAILSLLVSSEFGPGLQGLYAVGLVSHQLGAPLFCLGLGALLRVPRDTRWRWVLLAAVSLAALAITHLISVMILAAVFPLLAFGLRREHLGRAALTRFALTGVLAAALAAWWLIPVLAHRDLRGEVATWATPPFGDRLDAIVNGRILFRPYTVWIVVAGWIYALVRVRRRPFALVLVVTPLLFLVLAHWAASRWPDNEIAIQLANRGLGYAGLLAVLPVSAGIAAGERFARRRLSRWRGAGPAAVAAAMLVAVAVVVSPFGPDRGSASEFEPPIPQLQHAAAELRRDVPDGARFVTQREYPGEVLRTGVLLPPTWLARASGRNSLNGWNLESSSTPEPDLEPDLYLGKRPAATQADVLSRLGVSHVVTTGDPFADALAASDRFELVWREPPIAIFAVRPRPGQPDPAALVATDAPATARFTRADPERLRIRVDASAATPATVAVAWSPKWHGRVDGRPVAVGHTDDGLITVRLPAGSSTLELAYGPDGWDRLGVAVSALTVALLGALGVLALRRRRQSTSS
jgi:negative regulator of sigma E activity